MSSVKQGHLVWSTSFVLRCKHLPGTYDYYFKTWCYLWTLPCTKSIICKDSVKRCKLSLDAKKKWVCIFYVGKTAWNRGIQQIIMNSHTNQEQIHHLMINVLTMLVLTYVKKCQFHNTLFTVTQAAYPTHFPLQVIFPLQNARSLRRVCWSASSGPKAWNELLSKQVQSTSKYFKQHPHFWEAEVSQSRNSPPFMQPESP